MKVWKKGTAFLCAILLVLQLMLAGCGGQKAQENETTTADTGSTASAEEGETEDANDASQAGDEENGGTATVLKSDFTEDTLNEYEVPEWFRDAKFGIFIHYGVYSVPAYGDEWYGHWMYMEGTVSYGGSDIFTHHLKTYGGASEWGYKDFIPLFVEGLEAYKENNMAEEWAALFAEAGAQYVMPVGIHHDSFALYDSDVQTTYNSVTQAGVDYIADLQEAVTAYGMKFGISNHFAENDWFFDDASGAGTDLAEKNEDGSLVYGELYGDGLTKSSAHVHKWYDISMEIIEKYHPDLIYYDFDLVYDAFDTYDDANRYLMLANYYNQAAEYNPDGVVCCYKNGAFTQAEAMLESERSSLSYINPTPWQSDTSIGQKSWGYTTDDIYRSGEELIGALVDIVSKNGNLLLNVGPEADGTIPDEVKETLLTIGAWLETYGDAIYATRPWLIAGEGPTNNSGDTYVFQSTDIRFTKSKDNTTLYATALAAPTTDTMVITSLNFEAWDASTIERIALIDGDDRVELTWTQTEEGLAISIPQDELDGPYSVEITFADDQIPALATDASAVTQPSDYYEASGIELGHSTEDGSYTVVNTEDGAYVKQRLDFTGLNAGTFQVTVSGESQGTITVYDDETGEVIISVTVEQDADSDFRQVTVALDDTEAAGNADGSETSEGAETTGNADETDGSGITGRVDIRIEFTGEIELSSYRFIEKRELNTEIDAAGYDTKSGTVQAESTADTGGGESLGYVSAGDYVVFSCVDFGTDCVQMQIRAGAAGKAYRVYIDSMDADNLIAGGTISTGGYNNYQTICEDISDVTGVHDVYFVFVGDAINLNWILFADEEHAIASESGSGDDAEIAQREEEILPGDQIEAESYDGKSGTVAAETIADGSGGQNLGWVTVGDWVCFTQVNLTGASSITARLAGTSGSIEVRLDSPDGTLLAEFETVNTGSWSTYEEYTVELGAEADGVHTLYFVFTKAASNFDWFLLN
ncbi:MAG: alpha-L-fucosidase [Lachnospiraceae bacterium]|nr:alpha-L-fucosidase [Lachnospiraceae bacterium]